MGDKLHSVYVRSLWRALGILGGKDELGRALATPMHELESWLDGRRQPPLDVFLKVVDILSPPAPQQHAAARTEILTRQSQRLVGDSRRVIEESRAMRAASRATREEMPRVRRFLDSWFDDGERDSMLQSALDAALEAGCAQKGNLQLHKSDGLHIVAQHGFEPPFLEFFACVTDGSWACGSAEQAARRIVIEDVAGDYRFAGTPGAAVMKAAQARAVQSTPLIAVSGCVLGVLSTHYPEPRIPPEADFAVMDRIARRVAFWLQQTTTTTVDS